MTDHRPPVSPIPHPFEADEWASGMVCTRMVMRDGGGDACGGTPAEHRSTDLGHRCGQCPNTFYDPGAAFALETHRNTQHGAAWPADERN